MGNVSKQWSAAKHTRQPILSKHRSTCVPLEQKEGLSLSSFSNTRAKKSDPQPSLQVAAPTELEYSTDAHWPWTYKIHAAGELLSQQFSFCSKFYQLHWRSFNFFGQSARFIICVYFHALCLYSQWCLFICLRKCFADKFCTLFQ